MKNNSYISFEERTQMIPFRARLFIWVCFFALVIFTACDTPLVQSVKETKYAKGITIAELFEDSDYCSSVDWLEVEYSTNKKLVKVECTLLEDSIFYKDFDVLVYHFEKFKNHAAIYNSYYQNDKEQIVERSGWEAKYLLDSSMEDILKNK
ncbi:hypothetical protein [Sulfurimonas microaerophilic]|uniref:hypothetical protein n=1 Tax=Sulfurimonas microaerophilic TaxID=3058392 RepID=UPI002714C955|nr:hypothetical protein [Sulfurimonas sp. hsl 1-7]